MASPERRTQRLRIAEATARLLREGGLRDYGQARRKAARSLGIDDPRLWPDGDEIERALRAQLALFGGADGGRRLHAQRQSAREAMVFLAAFEPRLAGAVLAGTAGGDAPVELQVFAEPAEAAALFLAEQRIPHRQGERRILLEGSRAVRVPVLAFSAGEQDFELIVLPPAALRQAPRDPLDGRPIARAGLAALDALLSG